MFETFPKFTRTPSLTLSQNIEEVVAKIRHSQCEARRVGHHVVPGGVEAGRHGVQTSATPCWTLAPSYQGTRDEVMRRRRMSRA